MCIILPIVLTLPNYLKSSLSTLAMVNNISNHCLLSPLGLYQFVLYFPPSSIKPQVKGKDLL